MKEHPLKDHPRSPRRRLLSPRALRLAAWALLLVTGLQQALLPALTQPRAVAGADGGYVVLCTLQGLQRVWVGDGPAPPGQPEAPPGGSHDCPACVLYQLGHAPVPAVAPLLAGRIPGVAPPRAPRDAGRATPGPRPRHPIRAPPVLA